jgi:hypothetical protein
MDSSQIVANVLVACASASVLFGAVDPVRVLVSHGVREVIARHAQPAFRVLQLATGLVAMADWIFALILIDPIRNPLLEGGLLAKRVAGLLILPLLATAIWLLALSRLERSRSVLIAPLIIVLAFVTAAAFAVGMAIQLALTR